MKSNPSLGNFYSGNSFQSSKTDTDYELILSGLSNETMTTAFLSNPSYCYYLPLLYRYVRLIIKQEEEAKQIAHSVLADQYDVDWLNPSKELRSILLADLRQRCFAFKHIAIFDRSPVKIPFT